VTKRLNFDLEKVGESRKLQLDEFEEISNDPYECLKRYKNRMKMMHDMLIIRKNFWPEKKVILYSSCSLFFTKN